MGKNTDICISQDALDRMMPMHVIIGPDEVIRHVGPTLAKTRPGEDMTGRGFFDVFEARRQRCQTNLMQACATPGMKVYLRLRDDFATQLIGTASLMPDGAGILLNLSFGIAVVDAVGHYDLAGSDFAPTDLTLEMLYLVEAKSAAMAQSVDLNGRLKVGKQAAEADAASDMLTGLANRRILDQVLARLSSRNVPFTLMHLDLDFFKAVNDTLGHAAGDHVLQVVAEILNEETRAEDTVARVGGDEFVLVFDRLTDMDRIGRIANRMIERLEEPIECKDQIANISGSIGIVNTTQYNKPDTAQMMEDADTALYASKERGRACYTLFETAPNAGAEPQAIKAG